MPRALLDLFEFLRKYPQPRVKKAQDLNPGDVVACFDGKKVCGLGTVKHVGKTTLANQHDDGEFGDVFVLPHDKKAVNKKKELTEQNGWWRFGEVAVLPTTGLKLPKDCFAEILKECNPIPK